MTLRRASRGDLFKNVGVRLGGRVRGFRLLPVPDIPAVPSHARMEEDCCILCKWSRFSVDAGRMDLCFGYHPRAGPPVNRSISPVCNA